MKYGLYPQRVIKDGCNILVPALLLSVKSMVQNGLCGGFTVAKATDVLAKNSDASPCSVMLGLSWGFLVHRRNHNFRGKVYEPCAFREESTEGEV